MIKGFEEITQELIDLFLDKLIEIRNKLMISVELVRTQLEAMNAPIGGDPDYILFTVLLKDVDELLGIAGIEVKTTFTDADLDEIFEESDYKELEKTLRESGNSLENWLTDSRNLPN